MTLHRILAESITLLCLSASAIGVYRFKYLSKELRVIFFFVMLGAFTELFNDYYKANIAQNNMPISHFYFTTSILVLGRFYHEVLKGYIKTWAIDGLMISFFVYSVINLLFIQSIHEFPSLLGAIGALMLIIFSILFFARIMTEAKIQNLRKEPLIWINVGLLFYYSGSFFYFIMFNLNVENAYEFARQVGVFVAFINVAFYILITVIFILVKRKNNVT